MIGIIARTWFTSTKGGSELYIKRVFEELKKKQKVFVVTLDHDLDPEVIQISLPRIPFITQLLFSLLASKKINSIKPDVCIINQYWAEFSPLLLRVPWVPVIHDLGLFSSKRAQKNLIKHLFRINILKFVTKKSKIIIVPSKLTSYDLQRYLGVPSEKIRIVNEGVDPEDPKPSVPHEGINILCVARVAPNKGHDVLLEAFKSIKQKYNTSKLFLVGGISRENRGYFQKLKDYLEKFEISDVIFTGYVNDSQLRMYYRAADIYVQPSIGEEGWGITITEAYRHRIPVICTEIFRKTGVADDERALIVRSRDSKKLAKAIEELINNKSLRDRLSEKGYLFAKELSWEKMSENMMHVIEDALKS